jgi:hypothetical protein
MHLRNQPGENSLTGERDYDVSTAKSADHLGDLYAFFRGEIVPIREAKVNVMTHALHYGTGVLEGIRGNWNKEQGVVEW